MGRDKLIAITLTLALSHQGRGEIGGMVEGDVHTPRNSLCSFAPLRGAKGVWIPAYAGMTEERGRNDGEGGRIGG